ncbi:hypothetical protein [Olivibacter sitiensis]|uniref:hypothetical protein n=1 Tax=Olivibacter sitiensis TaxID=376470 RepID=UPI0004880C0F|nr:hypothetical protein [Olivibacter sitiensis]
MDNRKDIKDSRLVGIFELWVVGCGLWVTAILSLKLKQRAVETKDETMKTAVWRLPHHSHSVRHPLSTDLRIIVKLRKEAAETKNSCKRYSSDASL